MSPVKRPRRPLSEVRHWSPANPPPSATRATRDDPWLPQAGDKVQIIGEQPVVVYAVTAIFETPIGVMVEINPHVGSPAKVVPIEELMWSLLVGDEHVVLNGDLCPDADVVEYDDDACTALMRIDNANKVMVSSRIIDRTMHPLRR